MKQKPIRSPKHRKFVSEQRCMLSKYSGEDIHPHHLLRVNPIKGGALKSSDEWCVPLRYTLHDALHRFGDEVGYFALYGLDYDEVKREALYWARISPDIRIRHAARDYEAYNNLMEHYR